MRVTVTGSIPAGRWTLCQVTARTWLRPSGAPPVQPAMRTDARAAITPTPCRPRTGTSTAASGRKAGGGASVRGDQPLDDGARVVVDNIGGNSGEEVIPQSQARAP